MGVYGWVYRYSHGYLRVGECWYMVYIGVGMTMGVSWYMGDYG